jgi:hypothetical protein
MGVACRVCVTAKERQEGQNCASVLSGAKVLVPCPGFAWNLAWDMSLLWLCICAVLRRIPIAYHVN